MMKHIFIGILMMWMGASTLLGQGGNRFNQERIESLRTAHFTNEMQLKSKDAQVFWPWFNEREGELKQVRRMKQAKAREMQQVLSEDDEKEIERILDEFANLKVKEAQIQRAYHDKLKELMPIRKVVLFYKAENSWEKKLIRILQQIRENRQGRINRNRD